MAIDISTNTSKLNKQVLANAVSNAAYLSLGADVIDAAQGSAAMIGTGEKYTFTLFAPSAKNYDGSDKATFEGTLTDVVSKAVELEVGRTYSKIKAADLDRANINWEGLGSDAAVEIMNERVAKVVKEDMGKMPTLVETNVKGLLKASAKLAAVKKGKQYGFASPVIIGEIAGSGTTLLPCTAPGAMTVDSVKVWNISNLLSMDLPSNTSIQSSVTCDIALPASGKNYSVATASGMTAGNVYVFKSGSNYYTVYATSATSGICAPVAAAVTGATGVADVMEPMIIRIDKAQAYKDFGAWLECDEKVTVEGVTLGLTKKRGNLSDKEYLYEMANCSGVADPAKVRLVWFKV